MTTARPYKDILFTRPMTDALIGVDPEGVLAEARLRGNEKVERKALSAIVHALEGFTRPAVMPTTDPRPPAKVAPAKVAPKPKTKWVYERGDEFTPARKAARELARELDRPYQEILGEFLEPEALATCNRQAMAAKKGRWVEVPA